MAQNILPRKSNKGFDKNEIETLYIDPGSPWQNGYIESFHSRFRDECLNREWLLNLREARLSLKISGTITTQKGHIASSATLARKALLTTQKSQPKSTKTGNPVRIIGPQLHARDWSRQQVEVQIGCAILTPFEKGSKSMRSHQRHR